MPYRALVVSLENDLGADRSHLLGNTLRLLLGHSCLQHGRRLLHELLRLLQSQIRERPELLDNLELRGGVEPFQLHVERHLLLFGLRLLAGRPGSRCATGERDGAAREDGQRGELVDAEAAAQGVGEGGSLEESEAADLVDDPGDARGRGGGGGERGGMEGGAWS